MFLEKLQAGKAVVAIMLGNSIGMGYNDTGHKDLKSLYGEARSFSSEHRTDGDIGHSAMLRAYLKSKNPESQLINLSGDGWDTNDHLGISLPSSSVPPHQSTELVIEALGAKPDVVFIPLQINDANHGLSIATFAANTRRLVSFVKEQGIEPVIVKENYTRIEGYPKFVSCAGAIAQEMGVEVIDTYTPSRGRDDLLSDYAHPNNAGHKLISEQYLKWLNAPPGSGAVAGEDPSACQQ